MHNPVASRATLPTTAAPEAPVPLGVQKGFGSCPAVELWNDPRTGTTFAVHAGETLEGALSRTRAAFAESA